MAEGINQRHNRSCPAATAKAREAGARCKCTPTYVATVYDKSERKRKKETFPTFAAAKSWRSSMATAIERGEAKASGGPTLREAAARFLADAERGVARAAGGDPYKPSVLRTYESALRLRILPTIGGAKLGDIKRKDIKRLVDEMLAAGASASLIRNTFVPLRVIYGRAIEDGDVHVNPVSGVRLPRVRGRSERIATPSEAAALLAALDHDRALWATAFYAGLRRGELLALDWRRVDLARGEIRVERSWDTQAGFVAPKSDAGNRVVPIVGELRDVLLAHRLATWSDGLVFGASPMTVAGPTGIRGRALRAWHKAGLEPIGLHEGRHTFASICIAASVNAKSIQEYMGHSSIEVTFDLYGHLMPGAHSEAVNLVDAYLVRANTEARIEALASATDDECGTRAGQSPPV
jgi:integrase